MWGNKKELESLKRDVAITKVMIHHSDKIKKLARAGLLVTEAMEKDQDKMNKFIKTLGYEYLDGEFSKISKKKVSKKKRA